MTNNKLKKYHQKHHSRKRAFERFKLELNKQTRKEILTAIWKNKAIFIEKKKNGMSLYHLNYKNNDMNVLYDPKTKNIVTFLYPNSTSSELVDYDGIL